MSRTVKDAAALAQNGWSRMRTGTSVHVMPSEWRWLILVALLLTLIAFLPLIWIAIQGTGDYQFMGALHNYGDGATYLSKMEIGARGGWLVTFQHTSETHSGAFIQVLYPLLGNLSRLIGMPTVVMMHIARLGATLFMYIAIYQLAATIWTKVRARRLFFGIAVLGAGFGWLFSGILGVGDFPDLTLPEAFPLLSSLMNVHFPLTIAFLALLVGLLIAAFRPGAEQEPDVDRAMPWASLISFGLALLYPQSLVPIGGALGLHLGSSFVRERRVQSRHIRWLLAIGVPALPLLVYYALIVNYNPAMATWNRQNVTQALPPHLMLLGLGLPLILSLPGIWRAIRRMELDGDRFFLFWLIAMIIAVYLPTNIQRRFLVGLMIPIAYFATRALEDVWLTYVNRRRRTAVYTLIFAVMPISMIFVLFAPLALFADDPQQISGVMLERDYVQAFNWLEDNSQPSDVVLASEDVAFWVPGYSGARVVAAHEYETLDYTVKRQAVQDWYGAASADQCRALLEQYQVRYIIIGPQERRLAGSDSPVCARDLNEVATFGGVTIYAP